MEPGFFSQSQCNNKGQTAREIITQNHESPVKDGGNWLTNTSRSCLVVAALIATAAFSSATAVPGGVQQTGFPTLEGQPAFDTIVRVALVALCFSVTSIICSCLYSLPVSGDGLWERLAHRVNNRTDYAFHVNCYHVGLLLCWSSLCDWEEAQVCSLSDICRYVLSYIVLRGCTISRLDLIKATVAKFLNAHTRFVHSDSSSFVVIFSGF